MFHYYRPPADFSRVHPAPHVARVAKNVFDTRELITSAGTGLHFPRFFGKNFDAFWDCVRDLELEEKAVVILHQDLPNIPEEDLAVWLDLLRDAILYWRDHAEEHTLAVWFPEDARERIEAVLGTTLHE